MTHRHEDAPADEAGHGSEPSADDETRAMLLAWLGSKRRHVLAQVEAMTPEDRRTARLPSGWTPLGLVQHLTVDVERFWFAHTLAGEDVDLPEGYAGWQVAAVEDGGPHDQAVLDGYRHECVHSDEVATSLDLDDPPTRPAELPYSSLHEVLLHVLVETATHAGHLDAVRELADGGQRLVLDAPTQP
ncbi:DUF664 domain-containing protein [Nocardioides sp. GY 10127]|uniref:mycothiol transferase n=1 Tax=Nocardioides sp. GY 10127 TaxID=2569762 RepID=UPI0010A80B50|nr:DUF664 domain-containing protein [Nocardioides sp. GY 10127]TIC85527.1 DUF664 domain-containing protein [Nocardioides sp. GY 10127]